MDETMGEWETCSWCVEMVKDSTLTCLNDGARVCRMCKTEFSSDVAKIGVDRG